MVETSLNLFDLGVLIVLGLSALVSFFRGFIREVLSLGAWVGAAIITLYWFPDVAEYFQQHMKNTMVASGLAAMGTFMAALVVISLFNSLLLKYVKTGADVGLLDNALGLAFGIARGLLLVSIAYFLMTVVISEDDYPEWVQSAVSRPYVEATAKWISEIAPNYLDEMSPLKDDKPDLTGGREISRDIQDAIKDIGPTDEDAEPSSRWESLEELRQRMGE